MARVGAPCVRGRTTNEHEWTLKKHLNHEKHEIHERHEMTERYEPRMHTNGH